MSDVPDEVVERMVKYIRRLAHLTEDSPLLIGAAGSKQEKECADEVRAIVALLPDPVDPDWLEAGRIAEKVHDERGDRPFSERYEDWTQSLLWQGIKRGRELALTSEGADHG